MTELPGWESESPTDPKWTEIAFRSLAKGDLRVRFQKFDQVTTLKVSGPCPRCLDEVGYNQVLDIPLPIPAALENFGRIASRKQETFDTPEEFDVSCWCNGNHPGRPQDSTKGCGIVFKVSIKGKG